MTYREGPSSVASARRALEGFARARGFVGGPLNDVASAVSEAIANAVEHGAGVDPWFQVRSQMICGSLMVEISDGGAGFDAAREAEFVAASRLVNRGLGITLMRAFMDRIEYSNGGTCLRLFKRRPFADHVYRIGDDSAAAHGLLM